MGGPCFVFLYSLYEQIPARGALIALDLTRCAPVEAASSSLPATFQKENTLLTDGVSFCDCPQVLLSALPPTARKGECEGGTFDGFPHSRSITRPQATTFAEQKCCSKKKDTRRGVFLFGAGYGSRTRLNGLGSRCNTDIPTLRFTYRVIVAYRRRFCNRKLCRKGMNVLSRRIPIEKSLEGTL